MQFESSVIVKVAGEQLKVFISKLLIYVYHIYYIVFIDEIKRIIERHTSLFYWRWFSNHNRLIVICFMVLVVWTGSETRYVWVSLAKFEATELEKIKLS